MGSCRLATFDGKPAANKLNRPRRVIIPTKLITRLWKPLLFIVSSRLDYGGLGGIEPLKV